MIFQKIAFDNGGFDPDLVSYSTNKAVLGQFGRTARNLIWDRAAKLPQELKDYVTQFCAPANRNFLQELNGRVYEISGNEKDAFLTSVKQDEQARGPACHLHDIFKGAGAEFLIRDLEGQIADADKLFPGTVPLRLLIRTLTGIPDMPFHIHHKVPGIAANYTKYSSEIVHEKHVVSNLGSDDFREDPQFICINPEAIARLPEYSLGILHGPHREATAKITTPRFFTSIYRLPELKRAQLQ